MLEYREARKRYKVLITGGTSLIRTATTRFLMER